MQQYIQAFSHAQSFTSNFNSHNTSNSTHCISYYIDINANAYAGGYDEPPEEELLANKAGLLDNPVLLLYGDSANRGVVVFALQVLL